MELYFLWFFLGLIVNFIMYFDDINNLNYESKWLIGRSKFLFLINIICLPTTICIALYIIYYYLFSNKHYS